MKHCVCSFLPYLYCLHARGSTLHCSVELCAGILATYSTYVCSYLQAPTIGSSVALPMSALSHWMNCGSTLAMVASNN